MTEQAIKSTIDISKIVSELSDFQKKLIPQVATDTVNHVANIAAKKVREAMQEVFDRPTPYTLNSVYVLPAKVVSTEAFAYISIKDWPDKGIAAHKYLSPQIYGGGRNLKRSEEALMRRGFLPTGSLATAPGKGMKLNAYGNIPGSTMVSILSGLKAFNEAGYVANRTAKSAAGKPKRQFVVFQPKGFKLGIWERYYGARDMGKGARSSLKTKKQILARSIRPLISFVEMPDYKPRLHFHKIILDEYNEKYARLFLEKLQYNKNLIGG